MAKTAPAAASGTTSNFQRWLVVMTAALLFFYTFIQMNMLNPIDSKLMSVFAVNAKQLGVLSTTYFWGNFLFLFPAGIILDRLSPRKIVLISMLVGVVTMFTFASSSCLTYASISRFCSGVSGAFAFIAAMRIATRWFEPKKLALVSGCIVTLAMLGGVVAQTPMEILTHAFGWRYAITVFGFLGIAILILMFFVIRDYPKDYKAATTQTLAGLGFWRSIKMVVTNAYNWLAGLYTTLMNLPIFLLAALWGSMYLVQIDHFSKIQAANIDSMLFFGTVFGSPIVGWISDKLGKRILPMLVGAILAIVIMFMIMYMHNFSYIGVLTLFFLLGLITSTQVISYPLVTELNSPLLTSSAISIVSVLLMFSAIVCQPMFGWLMDMKWNHLVVNHTAIYAAGDFRNALWIMPIGFIISVLLSFVIKETNCKPQVS